MQLVAQAEGWPTSLILLRVLGYSNLHDQTWQGMSHLQLTKLMPM